MQSNAAPSFLHGKGKEGSRAVDDQLVKERSVEALDGVGEAVVMAFQGVCSTYSDQPLLPASAGLFRGHSRIRPLGTTPRLKSRGDMPWIFLNTREKW